MEREKIGMPMVAREHPNFGENAWLELLVGGLCQGEDFENKVPSVSRSRSVQDSWIARRVAKRSQCYVGDAYIWERDIQPGNRPHTRAAELLLDTHIE